MQATKGLSRRSMLQLAGAGVLGAGIALSGCKQEGSTPEPTTPEVVDTSVTLKVYDPTGAVAITSEFSPRLDKIDGKTIAFVSDDEWEAPRIFDLLEQLITEKYSNVTILREDNFAQGVVALTKDNNGVPEVLHSLGADAVIIGVAG